MSYVGVPQLECAAKRIAAAISWWTSALVTNSELQSKPPAEAKRILSGILPKINFALNEINEAENSIKSAKAQIEASQKKFATKLAES